MTSLFPKLERRELQQNSIELADLMSELEVLESERAEISKDYGKRITACRLRMRQIAAVIHAAQWCNRCGKSTQHTVSAGRVGSCMEHQAPNSRKSSFARGRERREKEKQNPRFEFGEPNG